jgi:hypothetical protein
MRAKFVLILFILLSFIAVSPIRVNAISVSDFVPLLVDGDGVTSTDDVSNLMDNYNQEQTCTGNDSLLGNPDDPNSVAWLIQQALNIIKVVGPILVIILSSIDFIVTIVKSDDESMAKAQKKLITRLILVALLFFIPTITEVLLRVFHLTSTSTCGLK